MTVLIVGDNEFKYAQIKKSLDNLITPWVVWEKSKIGGLASLLKHNVQKQFDEPFDLIIIDDDSTTFDEKPFAKDIVDRIRKYGLKDLPIVVCSSDDTEECDCNYKVKFDSSTNLDEVFQVILDSIIKNNKQLESGLENGKCLVKSKK